MVFLLSEKDHKPNVEAEEEANDEEEKPEPGKQNHFARAKWKKQNQFTNQTGTLAGQVRDFLQEM